MSEDRDSGPSVTKFCWTALFQSHSSPSIKQPHSVTYLLNKPLCAKVCILTDHSIYEKKNTLKEDLFIYLELEKWFPS